MPSAVTVRNNYGPARCCGTCLMEGGLYCRALGMTVRPCMTCDRYRADPKRAGGRVRCGDCAFGLSGDRSCAVGCSDGVAPRSGCRAGRRKR